MKSFRGLFGKKQNQTQKPKDYPNDYGCPRKLEDMPPFFQRIINRPEIKSDKELMEAIRNVIESKQIRRKESQPAQKEILAEGESLVVFLPKGYKK